MKQGVFDVFVSEQFHDVKDVFCSMVFHGSFPMAESVKRFLMHICRVYEVGEALQYIALCFWKLGR